MQLELTKLEPCWVVCDGATGRLAATIKAQVTPRSYRVWEPTAQRWHVHYRWLAWLVITARNQGWAVDYSALPAVWQMLVAGASEPAGGVSLPDPGVALPNPFDALYVTDDAPDEVVKAAFKALAYKYHPDQGGSAEAFRKVDAAYRQILRIRSQ